MADDGFTTEERAAIKQRAAELRTEAKRHKAADKAAAAEQVALAAIAAMTPTERAIAERVHALVAEHAPGLAPKTWYGFPAYARAEGGPVVFFQPGSKFGTRYSTLGFQDGARLDDGSMWPTAFAITTVDAAAEEAIVDLLRRADPA